MIAISPEQVKNLAANWIKPRLDERLPLFRCAVQQKVGEFSVRGLGGSPCTYLAAEDVVWKELELRGNIVLEGYKRALTSVGREPSQELEVEAKREIESYLLETSIQLRSSIEYVRKAALPNGIRDDTDLTRPVVHKLISEFDILCVSLRMSSNHPNQAPSSVTTNFNAPVGSVQTGTAACATVLQFNEQANCDKLVEALCRIEEDLKRLGVAKQQPEVFEIVGELKAEAAKEKPNRLKLTSALHGIAPIISGVADMKPAYENLKNVVAALIGIFLP